MSQAGQIDGLQFARDRGQRSGHLKLDSLPRLADMGCKAARADYVIEGGHNAEQRPCLYIDIDGVLELICQRCLGPVEHIVEVRSELELATDPQLIESADDDIDRVLATRSMDPIALVEDELILALPMVPMHEGCGNADAAEIKKQSPFAALAALKKTGNPES